MLGSASNNSSSLPSQEQQRRRARKANCAMGNTNTLPVRSKFTYEKENDRVKYVVSTCQGWNEKMEDAFAAILNLDDTNSTSFFGVYDGHGGAEVALYCAKQFHIELCNHEDYHNNLINAVERVFFSMEEKLKQSDDWRELVIPRDNQCLHCLKAGVCAKLWPFQQAAYTGPAHEGSTACVVVVRGNQIIVGNAGDSRCVLSRNGQAIDLSIDHTPANQSEMRRIIRLRREPIYLGRICHKVMGKPVDKLQWVLTDCKGSVLVSRSFGHFAFKRISFLRPEEQMVICNPDIGTVDITDDVEFLVIASRGLWFQMSSEEVVDFVRRRLLSEEAQDLRAICEDLLEKGLPSGENTTVILVLFKAGDLTANARASASASAAAEANNNTGDEVDSTASASASDRAEADNNTGDEVDSTPSANASASDRAEADYSTGDDVDPTASASASDRAEDDNNTGDEVDPTASASDRAEDDNNTGDEVDAVTFVSANDTTSTSYVFMTDSDIEEDWFIRV
ncbi:hypothetical protein ABZP36_023664 [Zizania latifolia]